VKRAIICAQNILIKEKTCVRKTLDSGILGQKFSKIRVANPPAEHPERRACNDIKYIKD
jgi:hypothetical protein